MNPKNKLRGICALLCAMLLCSVVPVHAKEKEQIKISDQEYAVTLNNSLSLFISNEKAVSGEIGTKVFLTYTVVEVTENTLTQSGVVGTMDNTMTFPYIENQGRLFYKSEKNGSELLQEGYTYVFRFERTVDGFEYQAAKLKGDQAEPLSFGVSTKVPESEAYKYYGAWISGASGNAASAVLSHMRCFDENGNDLGIHLNRDTATRQDQANAIFDVHPIVDSSYSFSLEDAGTVAISSKYPAETDVVYMEYEVENVKRDDSTQQGLIVSSAPTATYPHANNAGYLRLQMYKKDDAKPLLREGGKYFIRFEKTEERLETIVQCTVDGKTEAFSFTGWYGAYSSSYPYFSIWLGEGKDYAVTADFKNVKCYDANGNSLGIQLNKKDIPVSHKGSIDDYSTSQAVFYCEKTKGLIDLQDEQKFAMDMNGVKEEGTYTIQGETDLYLMTKDGKEHYDYGYMELKDEAGNIYRRIKASTVRFVTGEETFEVVADAKTGFRVAEPEKPTKEGNTFKGWYLGDETAYDFETVVTESITLYAMWEDGDGNVYLALDTEASGMDTSLIIAIAASAMIASAGIIICIIIVRRRRHGSN